MILVDEGLDLLGMDGLEVKHLLFEDLLQHRFRLVLKGLELELVVGEGSLSLNGMVGYKIL